MREYIIAFFAAAAFIVGFAYGWKSQPAAAYPVACADIPESNQRVVIVRDGQVECHYKITRVKERHAR